jgi:hypothetical protein
MNLETLVERACLESGYNDTDDVTAAEKFARHWDEHIWNAALWKDALVACEVAIDPTTNDDHADGVVYLPEVIDRVVAVRCAANQIQVTGQEHYYRMDYDAFTAEGAPIEFNILPPAWFTWRWSDAVNYLTVSGAAGDATTAIKIVWVDGTGKRTVTETTVGAAAQLEPADEDKITVLAVYKETTTDEVVIASNTSEAINSFTNNSSWTVELLGYVGVDTVYTRSGIAPGETVTFETAVESVTAERDIGGVTGQNNPYYPAPVALTLEAVFLFSTAEATDTTVGTLSASDTRSPSYQRLRLFPKPTTAFTLKVLGKAKYEPLEFDQQEPALRNCINALLAFMRGSLKRRGGEIGAAQLEFQEGNALLNQVMQIEAVQAANNQRFMPAEGYGPEHGVGPYGIV